MVSGVMLGVRHFTGAGVLSSDEIFSPEQLLLDLEVRDHACRLAAGWDPECDANRAIAEIEEAIACGSFAALESTMEEHRKRYWTPRGFYRGSFGAWQVAGRPDPRAGIRDRVRELTRTPAFVAPAERQRVLDRILAEAQAALGTAYRTPAID